MLSRFYCNNCKISVSFNPESQQERCPRCKCGVNIGEFRLPNGNYIPATPKLGNVNGGKYFNKIAPIYGVGANFRLNKRNSGTRLNSVDRIT